VGIGASLDGTENLAQPGFDPWTVQPVASCYTNYTILAAAATQVLNKMALQEHIHVQL
jgi:hypothetical protein